jgi:hypothetical protein
MKTYSDNMLEEENTAHWFPRFKNGDGVPKLVDSMPVDQDVWPWELHTLEDVIWNDIHQSPSKY